MNENHFHSASLHSRDEMLQLFAELSQSYDQLELAQVLYLELELVVNR
jgi:hypothetical protein